MSDLEDRVSERLYAVMDEFDIRGPKALGDLVDAKQNTVSHWLRGVNLPRVPEMIRLCEQTGLSLDWLYSGRTVTMDTGLLLRLNKRVKKASGA